MFPDRISRVNRLIQTEISSILERHQELWSELGGGFLLTVTRVAADRSLDHADVYYSWTLPRGGGISGRNPEEVWAQQEQIFQQKRQEVERALEAAIPAVAHELSKRVVLKRIPKIRFVYDANVEAGDRVYQILEQLKSESFEKKRRSNGR